MILLDLTFVEKLPAKSHWRFSLVAQIGRGTIKIPGYRYYPDTEHLDDPRRQTGGKWIPSSSLDKVSRQEVIDLVKTALTYRAVEFNKLIADIRALGTEQQQEALTQLEKDSCFGAAIAFLYRRIHE